MSDSTRRFSSTRIGHDEERRRFRIVLWALAALYALTFVVACKDRPDSNPVSPTVAPPALRVLQQGNLRLAAPTDDSLFFALTTITDAAAGRWEASVDWTSEANTLWMWVADGACSVEQFARPECPSEATCPCRFAIRSETATPKPRVLAIPGAAGGIRTLIVANLGPREETAQYRVTLSSSSITTRETGGATGPAAATSTAFGAKAGGFSRWTR